MKNHPSLFTYFLEGITNGSLSEHEALRKLIIKHNAYSLFDPILMSKLTAKNQIIICCFIVMAYSNDSTWNDFDKPLNVKHGEIKSDIIQLLFKDVELDMNELNFALSEYDELTNNIIDKYLLFQKDRLYYRAVSIHRHINNAYKKAMDVSNSTDKAFLEKTKYINETQPLELELDKLKKDLANKYMSLDAITKLENKGKFSEVDAENYLNEYID